jgi:dihydrofolate reductase
MIKSIIAAVSENGVIGKDNKLLWKLSDDLRRFKKIRLGKPIIMGRKTFESIGKPLPGSDNIVITRNRDYSYPGIVTVSNIADAIKHCELVDQVNEILFIGGQQIYEQAMVLADRIYLTMVWHSFDGDVSFPYINKTEWKTIREDCFPANDKNEYSTSYYVLERQSIEDLQHSI